MAPLRVAFVELRVRDLTQTDAWAPDNAEAIGAVVVGLGSPGSARSPEGSSRMRISKAVDYMVRCVLFLARQEPGTVVRRRELVAGTEVPDSFLRKIVQDLARAGVLRVTRGPKAGYALAVPPDKLTLLRVVEVGTGAISLSECVLRPELCVRSEECPVHSVWCDIRDDVRGRLAAVTFFGTRTEKRVRGGTTVLGCRGRIDGTRLIRGTAREISDRWQGGTRRQCPHYGTDRRYGPPEPSFDG